MNQKDRDFLINSIRSIPDFPKKGIVFKDITTLLNNKEAFNILMNHLEERYRGFCVDFVAGIDARGFIFGSALADRLGVGFVPLRKKGKLPYTTVSERYSLEYGFDEIEVHIDAFAKDGNNSTPQVLLVDDLIATGGTASAGAKLIEKVGATCLECCFIIELEELKGRYIIQYPVYSVLKF
jgi:adenine phosphoribosyltransferase